MILIPKPSTLKIGTYYGFRDSSNDESENMKGRDDQLAAGKESVGKS